MRFSKRSFCRQLRAWLSSAGFFRLIVVLLVLQAAWLALSGRYPMAFDEDFHLGIIKIYAHHLNPFLNSQPAGADIYGAVARDPSYLYHYLLSFPYRLITALTHSPVAQVLALRFINIALAASGLLVYRKLLAKTGASRAAVNFCLLVFVLIPVVPFLAAQINYDNLLFPLSGLALLAAVEFDQVLHRTKRVNARWLLLTLIFCIFASLVKYAFLPIFLTIVIYLALKLHRAYPSKRKLIISVGFGFTLIGRKRRWLLLLLVLAGSLMFVQRDGLNIVRYHTPVPDCKKVLSIKECSAYGPWIRDYNFKINKIDEEHGPLVFTGDWLYGMWLRLFFSVGGPSTTYQTRGPLPLPAYAAVAASLASVVAIAFSWRRLLAKYEPGALRLLGMVTIIYCAALWLDEYRAYVHTGQPVAINGRYLLPVLLPMFIFAALAFSQVLRNRLAPKATLAGVTIVCLLWGGGALTYILRSNDSWDWQNRRVLSANHSVQRTVGPITPGFYSQTLFLK